MSSSADFLETISTKLFLISRETIYTNVGNAWIEYSRYIDADLYDAQFVEAFSWKLAAEIAYALTGKLDLAQMCIQAYNAYFSGSKA